MTRHRLFGLSVAVLIATTAVATEPARPLRSVAEILALPVDELDQSRPAVIEGVVTFAADRQQFLVVEDASGALYVSSPATAKHLEAGPLPPIEPGSVVEIEGEVVPGGYAPTLFPLGIRVTGLRPVPPARPADLGRLFRGGDTGRRVIVEGVVQEARPDEFPGAWLTLDTAVGILPLRIIGAAPGPPPVHLVDATIRAPVLVGNYRNSRGQFLGPSVTVASRADITVLEPAPADPFAGAFTPPGRVARFQPEPHTGHRIRTEGVVSYAAPGLLYLEAGDSGLRVELALARPADPAAEEHSFARGDRVQVAGFIALRHRIPVLTGAVARRIASGPAPQPYPLDVTAIYRIADTFSRTSWMTTPGSPDGRLLRCRGVVQALQPQADRLVVKLTTAGTPWSAEFRPPTATAAARLAVGSEVVIVGILFTDLDQLAPFGTLAVNPAAERVTLLARDADDITIVRPVSWWTRGRLLALLTGLSSALAIALGLAAILGRAVRRQAATLATTLRSQREATIEFESALRERNRLAANLHDTVLQTVTGLGFQLQACQVEAERQGTLRADRLELPRRMVSHAVEQLRGTVWALHAPRAAGDSLPAALEDLIAQLAEGHDTPVRCRFAGAERPLPQATSTNLLLVAQEAVTNALLHAAARAIDVSLTFAASAITLVVRDDGRGFTAGDQPGPLQGHFGLEGMSDRMQAIGGGCTVESRPGGGTTVTAVAPSGDPEREHDLSDRADAAAAKHDSIAK